MRLVIVYREQSEHRLMVETFIRDYKYRTGMDVETIDPDTRDGVAFCRTYDIVECPTIIALTNEGSVYQLWRGTNFPTISEVATIAQV